MVPILVALMPVRRVYMLGTSLTALSHFDFPLFADGFWSTLLLRLLAGIGWARTYMPGLKAIDCAAASRRAGARDAGGIAAALRSLDGSHGHRRAGDLGRREPERVGRAAVVEGPPGGHAGLGLTVTLLPGTRGYTKAIVAAQMLAQIGAFALPALLPDYIARWNLTKTEAGWLVGLSSPPTS